MIPKGRMQARFERRYMDYTQTLANGTPSEIGQCKPSLPDRRRVVEDLMMPGAGDAIAIADKLLDEVWDEDGGRWQRRLASFLKRLSSSGSSAFGQLVKAGCQPDALALQFWQAADAGSKASEQQRRIRADAAAIEGLIDAALSAVRSWRDRQIQLDELLSLERLRVTADEPGGAELKSAVWGLEDLAEQGRADVRSLRKQVDERRNPLVGNARVRLSRQIHDVTGRYRDPLVVIVLNDLLKHRGEEPIDATAIRRQRARWRERLNGGVKE